MSLKAILPGICSLLLACFTFSCKNKHNENSPFIGNWELQEQIIFDDTSAEPTFIVLDEQQGLVDTIYPKIDATESYWSAHDGYCYAFEEDGNVLIHGGADPISLNATYCIKGDTLIISAPEYDRFNAVFNVMDIGTDTIWVCQYDNDGVLRSSNNQFFKRIINQ